MTASTVYPDRETTSVFVRGQTFPGWFSGPACVWTGGTAPRVIGPFATAEDALEYQAEHAPGSKVLPIDMPGNERILH